MNKPIYKYIVCALLMLACSCERQTIYDPEYLIAQIPITFDWSKSLVDEDDINNVSIYFYPTDGSQPTISYSGDSDMATVSLYEGEYNILIHNEIAGNITGLDYENADIYSSYKMLTQQDDPTAYDMFYEPTSAETLIKESEAIAVWTYEEFNVTKDMIEYTRSDEFSDFLVEMRNSDSKSLAASYSSFYESYEWESTTGTKTDADTKAVTKALEDLLGIQPTPLTSTYEVNIEFENMNNIQYIEDIISGFVDGALVYSSEKSSASASNYTYFTMSDYTYNEGSETDGTLKYKFSNLGHRSYATEKYYLTLNIILHSGELVNKVIDITDQLTNYTQGEVIYIKIGDSFDNGTETIVLPANSGVGFGVGEWGEAENVMLG